MCVNAIFLDVDGVLNCESSVSKCGPYVGIDSDKVKRLARIVKETNSILILISSWKIGWDQIEYDPLNIPFYIKYLRNHLKKKGNLAITDITREKNHLQRGIGIKGFLIEHPEINNWIVLDDMIFYDYISRGIMPHMVKTDNKYGLTDDDADAAIKILRGQIQGPYERTPASNNITYEKQAGPNERRV